MILLIHLVALAITINCVVWGQCTIPIRELLDTTAVFFQNDEYMIVHEGKFEWNCGEYSFVTCSESTLARSPLQTSTYMQCIAPNLFVIYYSGSITPMSVVNDVNCLEKFQGYVVPMGYCEYDGRQGEVHGFGFVGNDGFRPYFLSCYDMSKASVMFTEHILPGSRLPYKRPIPRTPNFGNGRVPIDIIDTLYEKSNTEAVFERLLGSSELEKIKAVSFLVRGHLTPNADFVLPYFRRLTFFYDNVVPQWQIINNSNWKRVENIARAIATARGRDLKILTGVKEVLRLPDYQGTMHSIYLHDDKLEVPKWMWKIIKDDVQGDSIAFVTFNNPFRIPDAVEMICTDICRSYGWIDDGAFRRMRNGYTYCCDALEIMPSLRVDKFPAAAAVPEVMRNPDIDISAL